MRIVYQPSNGSTERVSTIHGVFIPGAIVDVPEHVAHDLLPREEFHRGKVIRRGNIAFSRVEDAEIESQPELVQIRPDQRGGSIARAATKRKGKK